MVGGEGSGERRRVEVERVDEGEECGGWTS